jgi:nucleotide-binding universal stress UspA family protein
MNETELSPILRCARVVVGVTGSASSGAALRRAVDEARRTGSELVPVLAWEPPGGEALYRTAPTPELAKRWQLAVGKQLDEAISAALGTLPTDITVSPTLVRAPAAWALNALADRPTDLLVLGGGRRNPLTRLLLGKVRRHTVARAKAPVLLIGPPERPRAIKRELRHIAPEDFLRPTTGRGR